MNVTYESRQEQEQVQPVQAKERPSQDRKPRYRLFGVEVIVKRTLVYGTLTAILILVYFSSVMLLQHLFHALIGLESPLVIAGSTLVIALLFQPLRSRIQTVIDRRFYHCKYDAVQTLTTFENRLRSYAELDLTTLTNDVLEVIKATMQPEHISILLVEPVHQEDFRDNQGWQNMGAAQTFEERPLVGRTMVGKTSEEQAAGQPQGSPLLSMKSEGQPVEVQTSATIEESAARMFLGGHKLLIARVGWVILAVCTLGLFLAAIPFHFAHLHVICADIMCGGSQSTAEVANLLSSLGLTIHAYAAYSLALQVVFALVYFTIATVIFWHKSNDLMALLVAVFLMTFVLAFTDVPRVLAKAYPTWAWPITFVGFIGQISFPLCFYLFPNGRFVPRWTRWLMALWIAWEVWTYILADASIMSNENFLMLEIAAFTLGLGSITLVQIYRYRHVSSRVQRQQTKWVVFGMVAALGGFFGAGLFGFVVPHMLFPLLSIHSNTSLVTLIGITANTATYLAMLLIPLSIGIAMLRYRLWEVDVLINRTLIYGMLIGILGLIFLGSLIAQQQFLFALIGQASELFIVGSTLGIVALFQPLRRVIKGFINRSFYHRKYKAEQVLTAFSTTLRDEVDLSKLSEHLVAVVQETMEPASISLWLRESEPNTASSRYTGLLRM